MESYAKIAMNQKKQWLIKWGKGINSCFAHSIGPKNWPRLFA